MKFHLKKFREARGLTQGQMAEMLGISTGLYNGLENGKRRMNSDYLQGAADIFGVRPADLIVDVPVAIVVPGRAGAGAQVHLIEDHAKGAGLYMVECPPQLPPKGIVAVEIEGDSMVPVYSQGDLLFYSRNTLGVPTGAINRKCVCEDEEGHIWIKQVKVGSEPGLFNLLSINPTGANLHNIRLKWAAPVRLHLPHEFVKRVGSQ
ncbi:helix-turn-helix transcriptional regulator [Plastorhodobacter daqingensis]|uniref:Helix-turn-helix transcriptional regulator n=1 Tax=Plastorhodobacter daqingensis TaxID=1387281 RepID=A0ABW2UJH2_9RHOB